MAPNVATMRWISDGAPLDPMIERSSRLTGDELHALADRYDASRSRALRAPVAGDLVFGMAWGMLPPQVGTLCDVVAEAARRAQLPSAVALRAWEAVADEMTARLFPQLPRADELRQPWREVIG
ncbi:MAG: hypothetical protein M3Y40_09120 [Chloroflexota bacterium]|nr:hypothetical protein [Chloroflexota bacterium]